MLIECFLFVVVACMPGQQVPLTEIPSVAPPGHPKLVVVSERHIDLGRIREGQKVKAVFTVENQGDADLIIERVKTGCGCTTVKLTDKEKVIPPGGRRDIVAKFDSKGRPGKQSNALTVYSNDRKWPRLTLKFTVEVETFFRTVPPRAYDFRNARRGEQLARPIDIIPTQEEGELEIVSVKIPEAVLRYTVEPLPGENSRGRRLRLTVDEYAPLGRVRKNAKISVKVGQQEETRQLTITGTVLGDLVVRPPLVKLEKPSARGNRLRPVVISSATDKPFEVLHASAGSGFVTTIEPQEDKTKYTIKLQIADDADDGPCGTFLEIRTDSVLQPLVRVPIFANVAPRISVDPPLVLLRAGGSPEAATRRVALQRFTGDDFSVLEVSADEKLLEVAQIERQARPRGMRYIQVSPKDGFASSERQAMVIVKTDVPGAEVVEIPVIITGPKSGAHAAGP